MTESTNATAAALVAAGVPSASTSPSTCSQCNAARADQGGLHRRPGSAELRRTRRARAQRLPPACARWAFAREERVLLLMQDCNDWPVSFLGAMYAGLVPVAVNTLLTADDYAYMLEHSRAQAVLVSGALAAGADGGDDASRTTRSPRSSSRARSRRCTRRRSSSRPSCGPSRRWPSRAATSADDPGFWLYSSGSTGRPKGTVHSHANPYWTAELYGKGVLGLDERDVCFSAAKLFFAYGLGNALTFPMSVGATDVLMAERPTPDATFKRWLGETEVQAGVKPTCSSARPPASPACWPRPTCRPRSEVALRLVSSAGEALPADLGERFKRALRRRHHRRHRLHRDAAHLPVQPAPASVRYGTTGWPVPGYDVELRGDDGRPGARRRARRPLHPRPERGDDVLGQPRQDARHLPGRLDQERRQVRAQRRRQLHLQRPQRRHAQGQRHLRLARSRWRPRWCSTRPCWKPR